MTSEHRVRVHSGKYTFVSHMTGIDVLRYDEPWLTLPEGLNAVRGLMAELDAARVVMQEVRRSLQYKSEGLLPSNGLQQALDKHNRLTADDEPPSSWCATEYTEHHREVTQSVFMAMPLAATLTDLDYLHEQIDAALLSDEDRGEVTSLYAQYKARLLEQAPLKLEVTHIELAHIVAAVCRDAATGPRATEAQTLALADKLRGMGRMQVGGAKSSAPLTKMPAPADKSKNLESTQGGAELSAPLAKMKSPEENPEAAPPSPLSQVPLVYDLEQALASLQKAATRHSTTYAMTLPQAATHHSSMHRYLPTDLMTAAVAFTVQLAIESGHDCTQLRKLESQLITSIQGPSSPSPVTTARRQRLTDDQVITVREALLAKDTITILSAADQDLLRDCDIALGVLRCTPQSREESRSRILSQIRENTGAL